jgi:nucleotide-binding universal stress UspA family protein
MRVCARSVSDADLRLRIPTDAEIAGVRKGRAGGEMKFLLTYDGSGGAKRGLEMTLELARPGDAVTVVGVAEGIPLFGHAGSLPSPGQVRECEQKLADAAAALGARAVSCTTVSRSGDPATAILEVAAEEGSDLIVLGTRGLSKAERWLVGSVSTKVLHHARCGVLVAR